MTSLRRRCSLLVFGWLLCATLITGVAAPVASASSGERSLEEQLLGQINAERKARQLPPLSIDVGLVGASQNWAASMATRVGLVHSRDGQAEIIARGSRTGQITDAWMRSTGHRNLIVDPNLNRAGVGVRCDATGQMWAVVQFTRADTSLGTLRSSAPSPVITPSINGSGCGSAVTEPSVQRLYMAYFARSSDRAGLDYWVGQMQRGTALVSVSDAFAGSSEFTSRYGALDHRNFVKLVYVNVLGREPDAAGYSYWVGLLNRGMPRGEVMIGFSESLEFRNRTGIH